MKSGIYIITCISNNKVYIGSAKYLTKRLSKHKWCLKNKCHCNSHIQNAFNLYGEQKFRFEIIELCDLNLLIEREQFWIDKYDASNREKGFNIIPYSDRKEMSEETKKLLSDKMKGRPKSELAKHNMRIAQQNRSEEWNRNISIGQTGLKKSETTKKNMSESKHRLYANGHISHRKGQKASEETRSKQSEARKKLYENGYKNPNQGRAQSKEAKQKFSETMKRLYENGYIHPNKGKKLEPRNFKKCYCVETNQVFDSFKAAGEYFNISPSMISYSVRKEKRCKKLHFKLYRENNATSN